MKQQYREHHVAFDLAIKTTPTNCYHQIPVTISIVIPATLQGLIWTCLLLVNGETLVIGPYLCDLYYVIIISHFINSRSLAANLGCDPYRCDNVLCLTSSLTYYRS